MLMLGLQGLKEGHVLGHNNFYFQPNHGPQTWKSNTFMKQVS